MHCRAIEKAPEITAWLAITVATVARMTSGSRSQSGASRKNGFSIAAGSLEHQRALAEIVQHQARQHEAHPGEPDRLRAEMPHVGVQRLGPGDAQHDGAEHDEGQHLVLDAELHRVGRRDRQQHVRDGCTISASPSSADGEEPERHHRAEHPPDLPVPRDCTANSADDHHDADRQHVLLQLRRRRPPAPPPPTAPRSPG